MIKKMNNKPEEILLVSGVKEIGEDINLNRERVTLALIGLTKESSEMMNAKFEEFTSDGQITDVEKPALQRELDSITADFNQLKRQAKEYKVGDSDEYHRFEDDFEKLYNLMFKIINSYGTYGASDLYNLDPYYKDLMNSATALTELILSIQTDYNVVNNYYSRTVVNVDISPEDVPKNTSTTISVSILYDGEPVDMNYIPASAVSFGLTGLASGIQASAFGLPSGATVQITELTHSALVSNCKSFTLAYEGIGSEVKVTCLVTLDSESMPF